MARVKISEFKAKLILYKNLQINHLLRETYEESLDSNKKYVVKVDQGVKGRYKRGLVALNLNKNEIQKYLNNFEKKGFQRFIIEEFVPHNEQEEQYLSIERVREGKKILYSKRGGVDIEKNTKELKTFLVKDSNLSELAKATKLNSKFLEKIIDTFEKNYFSFLEINPFVVKDNKIFVLDLAVEVDSVAEFFVNENWDREDFISENKKLTKEEMNVLELSAKSQASFKLDVLNPDGSIFMLLSGGGASIVLADEVYNLGFAKHLANYGEYSGNPNMDETYTYTKNILNLLIKSGAKKKVLIIAGGVANFTDVRVTFKGILKALAEFETDLRKQKVLVYVRRGGPHQKEGLKNMSDFLAETSLLGFVAGPELELSEIVKRALSYA